MNTPYKFNCIKCDYKLIVVLECIMGLVTYKKCPVCGFTHKIKIKQDYSITLEDAAFKYKT